MPSLSIMHELDHPRSPLGQDGVAIVVEGAHMGYETARANSGGTFLDIIQTQIDQTPIEKKADMQFCIGQLIGVRGGVIGLSVEAADNDGFMLNGQEMGSLRISKQQGIAYASEYGQTYFTHKLDKLLRRTMQGTSGIDGKMIPMLGFAIGLRHAALSPSRESQERVTA